MLMQPWFSFGRFELLRKDVESLASSLHKYCDYLSSHAEKTKSHQHELTLMASEDNASPVTLPGNGCQASSAYLSLEQQLASAQMYQPMFLN